MIGTVGALSVFTSSVLVEEAVAVGLAALGVFPHTERGTQWLAHPQPRWRGLAERSALVVLLAVALLTQLLTVSSGLRLTAGYLPMLAVALGLGPVVARHHRPPTAFGVTTIGSLAALGLFGLAPAARVPGLEPFAVSPRTLALVSALLCVGPGLVYASPLGSWLPERRATSITLRWPEIRLEVD